MSITLKNLTITLNVHAESVELSNRSRNPLVEAMMAALSGGAGNVEIHASRTNDETPDPVAPEVGGGNGATAATVEPAAASANPGIEEVCDLVMDALHDERYSLRTFSGILKAVTEASPAVTEQQVRDALDSLVDDDAVVTKRRRSDGATLYAAV